jgi:RNA polymerase sigma-70 factor (ECF subfamily)
MSDVLPSVELVADGTTAFPAGPRVVRFADGHAADDGRLVRAARAGDRAAFSSLYDRYARVVHGLLLARVGRDNVEDLVQDVFLTAWRRLDEVPEGDAARVWLYATARRVIANQRRSRRRRDALHERLSLEAVSEAHASTASDHEDVLVHEALRRLGPRDREVLLLAEWEGMTPAQIASVLGCLTVTARGRLHRARRRFRAAFGEISPADASEESSLSAVQPPAFVLPRGGS